MSAKCSSMPANCAVVRSISSDVRSSRANRATLLTISTEMRSDTALDARGERGRAPRSIPDDGEAVGEIEGAGGHPVLRQHVGAAAGSAQSPGGNVEVHDQLLTPPQVRLIGTDEEVLGAVVGRRHVQRHRLEDVDAHTVTGQWIRALQPAGVGTETELLWHQIRREIG